MRLEKKETNDLATMKKRIQTEIQPNHQGILKCRDDERRSIVSNDGNKIRIRTGVKKTDAAKSITYDMIKFAYEKISSGEDFDSACTRIVIQ